MLAALKRTTSLDSGVVKCYVSVAGIERTMVRLDNARGFRRVKEMLSSVHGRLLKYKFVACPVQCIKHNVAKRVAVKRGFT